MSNQLPLPTPTQNVVLDTSKLSEQSSASVWDRITNWVSDNKAAVYTIAGVAVVVTGAGVVYYLNDNTKSTPSVPKKSKKQRRTEKKKAEEEKKTSPAKDGR
jgi:import receptor subunit TOM70